MRASQVARMRLNGDILGGLAHLVISNHVNRPELVSTSVDPQARAQVIQTLSRVHLNTWMDLANQGDGKKTVKMVTGNSTRAIRVGDAMARCLAAASPPEELWLLPTGQRRISGRKRSNLTKTPD